MNDVTPCENVGRPKWMKILVGIFATWVTLTFVLTTAFGLIWFFQIHLWGPVKGGILENIVAVIVFIISCYLTYMITKWQNDYLDRINIRVSYVILLILLLGTALSPIPLSIIVIGVAGDEVVL